MVKGKAFGITIGGIAGYLLIGKGIRLVRDSVAYVTDAQKWKAYYKYGVKNEEGKICCVVPPGYFSCTRDIGGGKELAVEQSKEKEDASKIDSEAALSDAIKKAVKDWLEKAKAPIEAKECKETASEEENSGDFDGDDIFEDGNAAEGPFVVDFGDKEAAETEYVIDEIRKDSLVKTGREGIFTVEGKGTDGDEIEQIARDAVENADPIPFKTDANGKVVVDSEENANETLD